MIRNLLKIVKLSIRRNKFHILTRPIINKINKKPLFFMLFPFYQFYNFSGNLKKILKLHKYIVFVYRADANIVLIKNAIKMCTELNYKVVIVCLSNTYSPYEEFKNKNVYIISSASLNGCESTLVDIYKKALLTICMHAATSPIVNLCGKNKIKCMWWVHEPEPYLNDRYVFPLIPELNSYTSLYCISDLAKRDIMKALNKQDVKVLPIGFKYQTLRKQLNQNRISVLISANGWIKGLNVLKKALLLIDKKTLKKVELNIIDNYHSDYYYLDIKKHMKINVMNYCSNNDFVNLINNSNLVVIPSYAETLSFVAIECMAHRTPFLCSSNVGITKYFKKDIYNKIVFNNKDYEQLSKKIKIFLEHPDEFSEILDDLYCIYSANFTYEKFKEMFKNALEYEIKRDA